MCAAGPHGSEIHIEGLESQIAVIFFLIDMAGDIPFHMKKEPKTQTTQKCKSSRAKEVNQVN